jgi:adenylate cyclase
VAAVRSEAIESLEWRELLTNGHAAVKLSHRLFRRVPGSPRCKLCHNPFGGWAGKAFATIGCTPSKLNPAFCTRCCDKLPKGGAKVDVAVLFADIRGSTALGEHAAPEEYAALLNDFYETATRVLIDHDAIIDKVVGDEVMALFVRGFAGDHYRRSAAEAGIDLVRELNTRVGLPVGAAVNAGPAFVGSVGSKYVVDFTAVGDTVNTAARLQGHAGAGELVLCEAVYGEVERHWHGAEQRRLHVRGREAPIYVRVLPV